MKKFTLALNFGGNLQNETVAKLERALIYNKPNEFKNVVESQLSDRHDYIALNLAADYQNIKLLEYINERNNVNYSQITDSVINAVKLGRPNSVKFFLRTYEINQDLKKYLFYTAVINYTEENSADYMEILTLMEAYATADLKKHCLSLVSKKKKPNLHSYLFAIVPQSTEKSNMISMVKNKFLSFTKMNRTK